MKLFMLLLAAISCCSSGFQDPSDKNVAAIVNGLEISNARVDQQLKISLGKREIPDVMLPRLRSEALDHLINRHLVLESIESSGIKAGPSMIAYKISNLEDRLKEIGKSMDDHLTQTKTSRDELQYEFRWQVAWEKYLEKFLTDQNLQKHYSKNQRKFDGAQVRVSHILLKNDSENSLQTANQIREQIVSGKLSWNDAVKQHSIAESSVADHGDVGWINYNGPMVPAFCHAATELNSGDISLGVNSSFGTHLIQCNEIKPGKIGLSDARKIVRDDAMQFLFEKLAAKKKRSAKIVFPK